MFKIRTSRAADGNISLARQLMETALIQQQTNCSVSFQWFLYCEHVLCKSIQHKFTLS